MEKGSGRELSPREAMRLAIAKAIREGRVRSTYDPERRCLVLHKVPRMRWRNMHRRETEVAKRWDDG